jgi:hypothetical protein
MSGKRHMSQIRLVIALVISSAHMLHIGAPRAALR